MRPSAQTYPSPFDSLGNTFFTLQMKNWTWCLTCPRSQLVRGRAGPDPSSHPLAVTPHTFNTSSLLLPQMTSCSTQTECSWSPHHGSLSIPSTSATPPSLGPQVTPSLGSLPLPALHLWPYPFSSGPTWKFCSMQNVEIPKGLND